MSSFVQAMRNHIQLWHDKLTLELHLRPWISSEIEIQSACLEAGEEIPKLPETPGKLVKYVPFCATNVHEKLKSSSE